MRQSDENRAGHFIRQPSGHTAFIPHHLDSRLVRMDSRLIGLLSGADRALGRLDGVAETLPNPELFVAMYGRKEALLSSQIEGTQASLIDVLEFEAEAGSDRVSRSAVGADVQEVLNHQRAMDYGLERLAELPISKRLLKETHEVLMRGARGEQRRPGEFRRSQTWIGPPGSTIEEATFVPPPVDEMHHALSELERYIREDHETPILVKCALVHYQFETIHPFEDGNGRMGRLLITFLLSEHGVLSRPLLYLSVFLKRHKSEYYSLLNSVRESGDYESWIAFFLRGVREVSAAAAETVRRVLQMREAHIERVGAEVTSAHGPRLVEVLLRRPAVTVNSASRELSVSYQTANTLIADLEGLGLLEEITGRRRNRVFLYRPYVDVLGGDLTPE